MLLQGDIGEICDIGSYISYHIFKSHRCIFGKRYIEIYQSKIAKNVLSSDVNDSICFIYGLSITIPMNFYLKYTYLLLIAAEELSVEAV